MDVEEARVAGRAEGLNAQAASFLTGRSNDVAEGLFHGALVSSARMKTSEDEQLQAGLLGGEEVVVRGVVDASGRPDGGLRAAGLGRHAAHRLHALDARDLAERAFRADRLRGKEQPGDGVG